MPTASRVAGSIRSSLPVLPAGASTRCNRGANVRSSNPIPALAPGRGTGTKRSVGTDDDAPLAGTWLDSVFGLAVLATGGGAELCVERQPAKTAARISAFLRDGRFITPSVAAVLTETGM
jgi:hypothetical protein